MLLVPKSHLLFSYLWIPGMSCTIEIYAFFWTKYDLLLSFRRGILGSALVTSIAVMISCASPNFITFLILRFIAGLGLGGASVLTTWGAECVPNLGKLIAMISLFVSYSIGTTMEASIARVRLKHIKLNNYIVFIWSLWSSLLSFKWF